MAWSTSNAVKFWLKVLLGIGLAVGVAIALQQFDVQSALAWIKAQGAVGIVAFVVLYNLSTVLFIPGSLLTLGGGALFGVFWGSVYVLFAATLGATIAFLIGRYLARGWVSRRIQDHPRFQAIDRAVAKEGFKIVLLTRLSPIFPFNLLNYAFGVTCVSLKDYMMGSVGMVPGTLMYVYLGALAGDIATLEVPQHTSAEAQLAQWLVKALGLLATIAVTVYITRTARRSLNYRIESQTIDY